MSTRRRWLGACGLLATLAGCSKAPGEQPAPPSPSSPASAKPSPSASAASAGASAVPASSPRTAICRALRVEGEARSGEAALVSGAEVDGSEWIALAKGASFTLKHSASGRELSFSGPARLRACRRGREQVLLAEGGVMAGSGLGARPGAEVLIATPVAVVRYGEAELTLNLDAKKLEVTVRAGQVELDPASPGQPGLKTPLHAKDKLRLPLGKPDPASLMARCKEAAQAAEASARRVGDKTAPEPLGERAQAHVRARRSARAACTIAAAATGLVADPGANAGLWAEAVRWEGLWETIPRKADAPGPEN